MDGYVRSYNPRTSFGEHQFFIYIPAQDASVVYLPIVPTRLGDISVTVSAFTLIGKDTVTRTLHVEVCLNSSSQLRVNDSFDGRVSSVVNNNKNEQLQNMLNLAASIE